MDYNGTELEAFDKAHIWRKYIYHRIKKFLKKDILEVGAGIGSFTINYLSEDINATLTDPDTHNSSVLKEKFSNNNNVKVFKCFVNEIKEKFHNILYLNVLEHIEDDVGEIEQAIEKLNTGGTLIILVPAHQKLYGNLDKAVGHFKRYDISFFENLFLQREFELLKRIFLYLMILLFLLIHQQTVQTHLLELLHHISLKFVWLDVHECSLLLKKIRIYFRCCFP